MASVEELINQAVDLYKQGQAGKALIKLKTALDQFPNNSYAHYNLGMILKSQTKFPSALNHLKLAVKNDPNFLIAFNNLALVQKDIGKPQEALKTLNLALKYHPSAAFLHFNQGNLYRELGQLTQAKDSFLKSLKLAPSPEAHFSLGLLNILLKDYKDAIDHLLASQNLAPSSLECLYYLAYAYEKNSQFLQAIDYYHQVVKVNPNYEYALSRLFICKRRVCDWSELDQVSSLLDETLKESPWQSQVRTESEKINYQVALLWSQNLISKVKTIKFNSSLQSKPSKKIRLGYISANFSDHPMGYLAETVFNHHDRNKFELFAYGYGNSDNSKYRYLIEEKSDKFRNLKNLTDQQASNQIYKDNIDILIDLTGYTDSNRLEILVPHPARIQVNWAMLGTSGAPFFDYIITDEILTPKSSYKYYSEKVIALKNCAYPNKTPASAPDISYSRADFGLPPDKFIFAVFNQMYKIEHQIFPVWMDILKATPNSLLWLWNQNEPGKANLLNQAHKNGVDKDRLIFAPTLDSDHFFARLGLADLSLDTMIYGGGTSLIMALIQGVPSITIKGSHFVSRLSSSILLSQGFPELIVSNPSEYRKLAIDLAQNRQKLMTLKQKVIQLKSQGKLFNYQNTIREIENSYISILAKHSR